MNMRNVLLIIFAIAASVATISWSDNVDARPLGNGFMAKRGADFINWKIDRFMDRLEMTETQRELFWQHRSVASPMR